MARSLAGRGVPVVLVTPRRSPLRELAVPGVLGVVAGDDDAELLAKLLDGVERHVVLVDDAELLLDTALDDALGRLVRAARDADQAGVRGGRAPLPQRAAAVAAGPGRRRPAGRATAAQHGRRAARARPAGGQRRRHAGAGRPAGPLTGPAAPAAGPDGGTLSW
jgi:hypothetical protein